MGPSEWGIVVEIVGAGMLVLAAWRARKEVASFPADVTYESLAPTLNTMLALTRRQVVDQLKGFAVLALGLLLQLYGNLA